MPTSAMDAVEEHKSEDCTWKDVLKKMGSEIKGKHEQGDNGIQCGESSHFYL